MGLEKKHQGGGGGRRERTDGKKEVRGASGSWGWINLKGGLDEGSLNGGWEGSRKEFKINKGTSIHHWKDF